jgi:hypothetical protein
MDYNEKLGIFISEIAQKLWKELDGKYDVTIDLVKGENVKVEIPVIAVYKSKDSTYAPFIKEVFEAFVELNTTFNDDFDRYVNYLARAIAKREAFCKDPTSVP